VGRNYLHFNIRYRYIETKIRQKKANLESKKNEWEETIRTLIFDIYIEIKRIPILDK
jgi:hypothetical protein